MTMKPTPRRWIHAGPGLLAAALVFSSGLATAQQTTRERPSITGPVVDIAPHQPTGPTAVDRGGGATPPGGTDIRANPVTNQAQNETSISVNPLDSNNWVGVANDYRFGTVQTGWYTTKDAGQTWTSGTFGVAPGFSFSGDPCVTFDANGDVTVVFMMYSGPGGSGVRSVTSNDGGVTWNDQVTIDLAPNNDKPQIGTDLSTSPNHGDISTAWVRFTGGFTGDRVWASTTTDGAQTWSPAQMISDNSSKNAIATDVSYGSQGEVYVMWADRGIDDIIVDRSFDGGATYGTDVKVADYVAVPSPIPGSQFRMFDIFAMAADWTQGPYSGDVYIAYHNWNPTNPKNADIRVIRSTDQGATWGQDVLVNASDTTNADQVMPGICVDDGGNVNVSYYDRRLDPENKLLWTWVARSSDGGASFSEHQVSDVGWNHIGTEFSTFIGDYADVDWSKNAVYPFWCDGRTGSQDVYTDVFHLNFFTDVSSLSAATGGVANFTINVGPNFANQSYFVLGSFAGTSPGVTFGNGINLPLNFDAFTLVTAVLANTAFLPGFAGTLDGSGSASAAFDSQGPFPANMAGFDMDFAVLVWSGGPSFATNATRVSLVP